MVFYYIIKKTTADVVFKETIQNQEFLNIFYNANIAKSINDEKAVDRLRKKSYRFIYFKI